MNRKAQLYPLIALIGVAVALLLWGLTFGAEINYWGEQAINQNGLTGIAALSMAHINLWVIIAAVIATLALAFGGGT